MSWTALLSITKVVADMASTLLAQLESLADAWSKAPPDAAAQRVEALAILAHLQRSLRGALDADDLAELQDTPTDEL